MLESQPDYQETQRPNKAENDEQSIQANGEVELASFKAQKEGQNQDKWLEVPSLSQREKAEDLERSGAVDLQDESIIQPIKLSKTNVFEDILAQTGKIIVDGKNIRVLAPG